MKRNIDINEISDGQLYDSDSLVKISCNDCDGCEKCCHNMGESIILDPFDIWQLTKITGKGFEQLLDNEIKLSVVDGIILPHINMDDDGESCKFLKNGKCSIHTARPGFCRLFPLGRIYDDEGTFKYFNQIYECDYKNKSKIKIKKWIGLSHLSKYEEYICNWHRILKNLENSFYY